ncbi:MAG: glutaredoxin family protein [Chlorobiales bacterium]|nr:glutaredoxin family protein [Chlorobiales bacterium]
MRKIVMYSTSWCPDCTRAEWVLKENGIPFEKVDIEKTAGAAETVMQLAGGKRVVPTLVVTDESGQEKVLVNPRPQKLIEAL